MYQFSHIQAYYAARRWAATAAFYRALMGGR